MVKVKISEIGGEFALIQRLTERQRMDDPRVIKGVGDDCAVLVRDEESHWLLTTDMMVENDHFSLKWFTPQQIGKKLVECNVSDIVSMGGRPIWGVISMSLPQSTELEFMDDLYEGIYRASSKYGLKIVGGDTTHGSRLVLNLTLIGEVKREKLRCRDMAEPGDIICVTGKLGGSTGGLRLLLKGISGDIDKHVNPVSRKIEEGEAISKYAKAMIDVSDGLGSEVRHICEESGTGAVIFKNNIPLSTSALSAAESLSESAYDYALYGGEDFELVFTISEEDIGPLRMEFKDFTVIGKILEKEKGLHIEDGERLFPIESGFDHFKYEHENT